MYSVVSTSKQLELHTSRANTATRASLRAAAVYLFTLFNPPPGALAIMGDFSITLRGGPRQNVNQLEIATINVQYV